ncbi:TRAP transporter small permease [uncultured Jannaschia sp.]|uniref:TRAP transporter small permease n=1 Tax=uncultured Jannaschia sp. TaxID=293347 RepID=UPI002623F2F7|nr:TRAP transporter small permease [uncultured Jannaschia sp.]
MSAADATARPDWPRRLLAGLCAILLAAMMALTVADVTGRYLLARPVTGATELTELLLVAVIFAGLPAVALDDGHVAVDLVTARLPDRVQPWRRAAISLVTVGLLAVVAWRLWLHAGQIAGYGAVTNALRLPVAPAARLAALATAASVPITLAVALRDLRRAR